MLNLITEDSIDFNNHIVSRDEGDLRISVCRQKIFYNCKTPIRYTVDSIDVNHFTQLEDSAIKLNPNYKDQYILALRFIYGINESKQLTLIYQPLFLKRSIKGNEKPNIQYMPDTSKFYYIYNHTSIPHFRVVEKADVEIATKAYRENIKFKTSGGKGPLVCRPFNPAMDETGDIRAHVFSFQEIKSVVRDHNAKILYILNAAETLPVNPPNSLKHVLLLGSEEFNKKNKLYDKIFYRNFGNLSHLCPPSCGVTPYKYNLK
jgi:hypothetical protein